MTLTPAELNVFRLVAKGLTTEQIAEKLGRSPRTVASQVYTGLRRLEARTRAHAVAVLDDGPAWR